MDLGALKNGLFGILALGSLLEGPPCTRGVSWSLHDPLKMGSSHYQTNGVMDPFLKGHGDSRLTYSHLSLAF